MSFEISDDDVFTGLAVASDPEFEALCHEAEQDEAVQAMSDWADTFTEEVNRLQNEQPETDLLLIETIAAKNVQTRFALTSYSPDDAKKFMQAYPPIKAVTRSREPDDSIQGVF